MREFSVHVTFRSDAALPSNIQDRVDQLLTELQPKGVVVTLRDTDLGIRITVPSGAAPAAIEEGLARIERSLASAGFAAGLTMIEVGAVDADVLHERNEQPPERFLGLAEVAVMFGVSKQRVSELRATPRFPTPVAELASGPVWRSSTLGRFLESWERKPGRPRKAVAS